MRDAFLDMLAGNRRHAETAAGQLETLRESQQPDVVTVCCGDSRVLQDEMWDNHTPGSVFSHSNIGNRVTQQTPAGRVVSGDVLYPLVHTGTETAVVVGHTGCGAVTATYEKLANGIDELDGISYCIEQLETVLEAGYERLPGDSGRVEAINRLVEYNVDQQVALLTESNDLPEAVDVVGAVYDFHDVYSPTCGEVHVVNVNSNRDVEDLRGTYPDIETRIRRYWEW